MAESKSLYEKVGNGLDMVSRKLSQLSVLVMTLVVLLGVFMRYFLKSPLIWTDELAKYMLVYMTFVGAPVALRDKSLAAMELVVEKLPEKKRKVVQIIAYILAVALIAFLFYYSLDLISQHSVKNQISPALQIPMTWVYFSLPLGIGLLLIQSIFLLIDEVKGLKNDLGGRDK